MKRKAGQARSGSPGQILISMAEADKVAAGALQQAIGVLRNIFSSPETVKSLASSLKRPTGSSDRGQASRSSEKHGQASRD